VRRSDWWLSTWSTTARSSVGSSSCTATVSSISSRNARISGSAASRSVVGTAPLRASWTSSGPSP
jgi:hypothetical protein